MIFLTPSSSPGEKILAVSKVFLEMNKEPVKKESYLSKKSDLSVHALNVDVFNDFSSPPLATPEKKLVPPLINLIMISFNID